MPALQTKTGTIHYRDEGAGEPVLLVHGNWTTGLWWQPVVERLSGQYRLLVPDLRGRGGSRATDGDFSIASLAADLGALLDGLGIARARLVGHSLGTAAILELALREPKRAENLTVVAPAWPEGMPAAYNLPERQRMAHADRSLYAAALRGVAPTAPDDELFRALIVEGHQQSLEASLATLDALVAWAPGERLRALAGIPALVVSGERDLLSTLEIGRRVADLLGARHHVVPGVGHSPNLEAPDAFVAVVKAFWRGDSP